MSLLPESLANLGDSLELPDKDLLQELVSSELLIPYLSRKILEALAEHSEAISPQENDLTRIGNKLGLKSIKELDEWRSNQQFDLATLEKISVFPQRLEKAMEAIWADEVPGRFLERRSSLDEATLSLLRFKDADLAQELYFQLLDKEIVFAELIDRYGGDPDQPARGLIGPIALEKLHPLLARAAERYEREEIIPPIEINGTIHLLRIEQIDKAALDEAMRKKLLIELRDKWVAETLEKLIKRLKSHHPSN